MMHALLPLLMLAQAPRVALLVMDFDTRSLDDVATPISCPLARTSLADAAAVAAAVARCDADAGAALVIEDDVLVTSAWDRSGAPLLVLEEPLAGARPRGPRALRDTLRALPPREHKATTTTTAPAAPESSAAAAAGAVPPAITPWGGVAMAGLAVAVVGAGVVGFSQTVLLDPSSAGADKSNARVLTSTGLVAVGAGVVVAGVAGGILLFE